MTRNLAHLFKLAQELTKEIAMDSSVAPQLELLEIIAELNECLKRLSESQAFEIYPQIAIASLHVNSAMEAVFTILRRNEDLLEEMKNAKKTL